MPALLVVDDNEDNRYTLTRRLAREGYTNLTTASNGREALDLLQSKPFDLVRLADDRALQLQDLMLKFLNEDLVFRVSLLRRVRLLDCEFCH